MANWSSVNIPYNPTRLVPSGDWIPQTVQLQVSTRHAALALKYLGIHNILNNTSTAQLYILSRNTHRIAIRIASRRASATVKAMVYNMYALARIQYYGPHLTSSLEDMRKRLDKPIQKILRKLSNNMSSFPTELLYITKAMAGLGFKCPTDIITTSKLAKIHRAQLQSTDAANIAAGMLMRPQRHQEPHWRRFEGGPLLSAMDDTPNYWALSLLQHLEVLGMEIALTPPHWPQSRQ